MNLLRNKQAIFYKYMNCSRGIEREVLKEELTIYKYPINWQE